MSVSFRELSVEIHSRYSELKGCGANKEGGGGFQTGNTCSKGGSSYEGIKDQFSAEAVKTNLEKLPDFKFADGSTSTYHKANPLYDSETGAFDKESGKLNRALNKDATLTEKDRKTQVQKVTVSSDQLISEQTQIHNGTVLGIAAKMENVLSKEGQVAVVFKPKGSDKYIIMDGNNRANAAILGGVKDVPVLLASWKKK